MGHDVLFRRVKLVPSGRTSHCFFGHDLRKGEHETYRWSDNSLEFRKMVVKLIVYAGTLQNADVWVIGVVEHRERPLAEAGKLPAALFDHVVVCLGKLYANDACVGARISEELHVLQFCVSVQFVVAIQCSGDVETSSEMPHFIRMCPERRQKRCVIAQLWLLPVGAQVLALAAQVVDDHREIGSLSVAVRDTELTEKHVSS